MSTRNRILSLTFAALALCAGAAAAAAADEAASVPVTDYTVFVDPPTGFVFVKLPAGWRFAGRLNEEEMENLPSSVVTSLLKADAESGFSASAISHVDGAPGAPIAAAGATNR